jgi:hypothetical protein
MDKRHLQPGDRVLISGNLPVLTDWGHGVEMNRDNSNQNIWYLDVNMPFGTIDYHAFGLFEYKFVIESPTEGTIFFTRRKLFTPKFPPYFEFRPNIRNSSVQG